MVVAWPVGRNPSVFTDQAGTPFHTDAAVDPREFEDALREFMARTPK
jgi:hypothetical protein